MSEREVFPTGEGSELYFHAWKVLPARDVCFASAHFVAPDGFKCEVCFNDDCGHGVRLWARGKDDDHFICEACVKAMQLALGAT